VPAGADTQAALCQHGMVCQHSRERGVWQWIRPSPETDNISGVHDMLITSYVLHVAEPVCCTLQQQHRMYGPKKVGGTAGMISPSIHQGDWGPEDPVGCSNSAGTEYNSEHPYPS
jgi:hypothetical protein